MFLHAQEHFTCALLPVRRCPSPIIPYMHLRCTLPCCTLRPVVDFGTPCCRHCRYTSVPRSARTGLRMYLQVRCDDPSGINPAGQRSLRAASQGAGGHEIKEKTRKVHRSTVDQARFIHIFAQACCMLQVVRYVGLRHCVHAGYTSMPRVAGGLGPCRCAAMAPEGVH